MAESFPLDLSSEFQKAGLELRNDLTSRLLYSTDASIYQVEPLGVAFPRHEDELAAAVELCGRHGVPLLARGAGSSLAGQAIGPALILDLSRHLNRILKIDPEACTATVEPGVVLNVLNRAVARYGLQFGPDPASAERATIAGSVANNATGAHSILWGMAADHLLAADVFLADGSAARFEEVTFGEARRIAIGRMCETSEEEQGLGREAAIYRAALRIREEYGEAIRERWPRTWRRASGYGLNYLLPWSPSAPPMWGLEGVNPGSHSPQGYTRYPLSHDPYPPIPSDHINLAPLLAGSEGTLAVMRRLTLRLVPLPKHTVLGVLTFPGIAEACDAVPALLEWGPSAVELIPRELIRLARSVPAYAKQLAFVDGLDGGDPAALLVVEFAGDDPDALRERAQGLAEGVFVAEEISAQRQVWGVRKVGLGILLSRPGDQKPWSFVEDLSVPVERLGTFVREMERILANHKTQGEIYAHASAGCLHIRPIINLKTVQGYRDLRSIATASVALTLKLGGSVSGEHGDGLARSEWLDQMYGPRVVTAFRELKMAADPQGLLNPGKIVSLSAGEPLPRMDEHLRFGPGYHTQPWQTVLDFSQQAGLAGAVEQCNGAGVCRKGDGVMCPSFQATGDEMHSTRGRANLLRAMLSGRFPNREAAEQTVYAALDLCLACKGCKAECPSAVDMAKIKYEFLHHYYRHHRRKLRDYLFGFIGPLARLVQPFGFLVNPFLASQVGAWLGEGALGLAKERPFPQFAFQSLFRQSQSHPHRVQNAVEDVLFLCDAFTAYFKPETGLGALDALARTGCRVTVLPVLGAGRTLISKGFLGAARQQAQAVVRAVERIDPEARMAVVGVEPSEIYSLRDEYADLLGMESGVERLAERSWMVDEFLMRPAADGDARILRIARNWIGEPTSGKPGKQEISVLGNRGKVLLHGHCYQKARPPAADGYPVGVEATVSMLTAVGYTVEVVDSGCCGMAGAFGYEAEHYNLSMAVGELKLLPAVRAAAPEVIVAACGVSCQDQIADGAGRKAVHPITLL